jgi:abortive infection bacteriophage resistance protein
LKYEKLPLSYEEQAERLLTRGLVADCDTLVEILESVSYYHLSAYIFPFKQTGSETLVWGTSLEAVYKRYRFDRRFRCLIFDALERFEIALKTKVVNIFSCKYGAFGYLDIANFNNFPEDKFQKFLYALQTEIEHSKRSREQFVTHYFSKYENDNLPFWMTAELMTFGNVLTMFRFMNRPEKIQIAKDFGLTLKVFESWLLSLNHVRNICAHHARLWNRRLGVRPIIPDSKKSTEWNGVKNEKAFVVVLMLSHLLRYCARNTKWRSRLESLSNEYPDLPLGCMDFPVDWKEHPLWCKNEN